MPTSKREKSALLSELRSELLSQQTNKTMIPATQFINKAEAAMQSKPKRPIPPLSPRATAAPAQAPRPQAPKPQTAPKPLPATVNPAKEILTTAAQFAKPVMSMTRSEFSKLNAFDKARYFKEGGKLI